MKSFVQFLAAGLMLTLGALPASRALHPPDEPEARAQQIKDAENLNREAIELQNRGQLLLAITKHEQTLAAYRKLYPESTHPKGHRDIALSLGNLGMARAMAGQLDRAMPLLEQSIAMMKVLWPDGSDPRLIGTIMNLGLIHQQRGEYAKALPMIQEAVTSMRTMFPIDKHPDGHPMLADAIQSLAIVHGATGDGTKCVQLYEESLAMHERLAPPDKYPQGTRQLQIALANLGNELALQGELGRGLAFQKRSLAMCRRLHGDRDHPSTASALGSLADTYMARAEYERALASYEEALAMEQRLYSQTDFPNGHPTLASTLSAIGLLHKQIGDYGKALEYYDRALVMKRAFFPKASFPDGHPDLLALLNNIGTLLSAMQAPDRAMPYFEEAVDMSRRLYPATTNPSGHDSLARAVANLGGAHVSLGHFAQAQPLLEEAYAMLQRLYPEAGFPRGVSERDAILNDLGHFYFEKREYRSAIEYYEKSLVLIQRWSGSGDGFREAASLHNLGIALKCAGRPADAQARFEQALILVRKRIDQFARCAPEAQALEFAGSHPSSLAALLSVTANQPKTDEAVYAQLWQSKAMLTRILERRHHAARIAQANSAAISRQWDELREKQLSLTILLRSSAGGHGDYEAKLRALTDEVERAERQLVTVLPELGANRRLDESTAKELTNALPPDTAFIDFIRYWHVGQHDEQEESYAAFILPPNGGVRRVQLGPAGAIDDKIRQWRRHIEGRTDSAVHRQAVADAIWEPLRRVLPAATRMIYLSPDGDLARIPWPALPGKQPGSVLLEDVAVAVVPHGVFLLKQLTQSAPARRAEAILALGDVDYGASGAAGVDALPGTASELKQLQAVAGARRVITLRNADANTDRLRTELPRAGVAHLATHGFFNDKELAAERKRHFDRLRTWSFETNRRDDRVGVGARNPLVYTGLLLASANTPTKVGEASGVLTGAEIVQWPLEGLHLVTLSACETGLGEFTSGEGVQGLQRAFHLAGCPNVIASLWKVNDAATAALMTKFYHELWVNKKPPIEALREAQLTIYRRPDLIATLASAERGVKLEQALNDKSTPQAETKSTTPTKLWAAFVLSGVGK